MKCTFLLIIAVQLQQQPAAAGYRYFNRNKKDGLTSSTFSLYDLNKPTHNWKNWESPDGQEYRDSDRVYATDVVRSINRNGGEYYNLPEWLRTQETTQRALTSFELTRACIRSCPVTSEYNPVCGTDNVTYQNPGRLECAKNCGVQVQLSRSSACTSPFIPPDNNTEKQEFQSNTDNSNNNNNIATEESNSTDSNKEYNENQNNGQDDLNSDRKTCGDDNLNKKTPTLEEVMACTQLCPLSSEYNPVCGTDGITYSNPGRLLCSQFCGIDVKVKKFAPCSSSEFSNVVSNCQCPTYTNPPPTNTPTESSLSPNALQACLDACPTSPGYEPVCGTNNITYQNMEKLNCASRCGIDVSLRSRSACTNAESNVTPNVTPTVSLKPQPLTLNRCIEKCSAGSKYEPVCGTDGVTYNNTAHLICARQCGVEVEMKSSAVCSNEGSARPWDDTTKPSPGALNFTIPPEVLASIFPNSEEDEDDETLQIDKRIKDETK